MSRKEFPIKVIREAWTRCNKACEGCGINLEHKPREYDHRIADGLTGEPTLENCQVLCVECHKEKTKKDIKVIAKAKRVYAKHNGLKIKGRGFPKVAPQRTATRPIRRRSEDANV